MLNEKTQYMQKKTPQQPRLKSREVVRSSEMYAGSLHDSEGTDVTKEVRSDQINFITPYGRFVVDSIATKAAGTIAPHHK